MVSFFIPRSLHLFTVFILFLSSLCSLSYLDFMDLKMCVGYCCEQCFCNVTLSAKLIVCNGDNKIYKVVFVSVLSCIPLRRSFVLALCGNPSVSQSVRQQLHPDRCLDHHLLQLSNRPHPRLSPEVTVQLFLKDPQLRVESSAQHPAACVPLTDSVSDLRPCSCLEDWSCTSSGAGRNTSTGSGVSAAQQTHSEPVQSSLNSFQLSQRWNMVRQQKVVTCRSFFPCWLDFSLRTFSSFTFHFTTLIFLVIFSSFSSWQPGTCSFYQAQITNSCVFQKLDMNSVSDCFVKSCWELWSSAAAQWIVSAQLYKQKCCASPHKT